MEEPSFQTIPYKKVPAVVLEKNWLICGRCGTRNRKKNCRLTENLYYCTHCLFLGRCDSSQQLFLFCQPSLTKRPVAFAWTGQLTFLQKTISDAIVNSPAKQHHLIWAVTGAG
ncbi:DNA/RNA helicase, partial [Enterococcus lactis]